MSLPSFPSSPSGSSSSPSPTHQSNSGHSSGSDYNDASFLKIGGGAGTLLPKSLLIVCGVCTIFATAVSFGSIGLQLKNYRRPNLQRSVVRIMIMVPLYAIASCIALFSLDAAFFIDAVRDLYEAFVIYTFFQLLITYLGGERSLLILLHGRPPIPHAFPVNLFLDSMDVSDPWVLLNLKRGVLQYVQIKPLLVIVTVILKATDTYRDGALRWDAGYTYVSVIYNTSICLSLYCLAMFWVAVSADLKPFRPLPKFLCVKGILFFSFWQGLAVSGFVAFGAIRRVGKYTDTEHMSLALTDSLLCLEMPLFAIAHQYAFQASDYIDDKLQHAARMPFYYALRDSFGGKDVWEDCKATFKGQGVSYQAYEPAEGGVHLGAGRMRRIRAGLRYSKGGKSKYWIPTPGDAARQTGETGPITAIKRKIDDRRAYTQAYAPLTREQERSVVVHHNDPQSHVANLQFDSDSDESDAPSIDFEQTGPADEWEEKMYIAARRVEHYGYPNVDVSKERAKKRQWEDDEAILSGRRTRNSKPGSGSNKSKGKKRAQNHAGGKQKSYGTWSNDADSNAGSYRDDDNEAYTDEPRRNGKKRSGLLSPSSSGSGTASPTPQHRRLSPPKSPFEIGEADDVSDPSEDEEVQIGDRALPSDALDLVVDDQSAVKEEQVKQRKSGEPVAQAITHIYRSGFTEVQDENGETRLEGIEEGEGEVLKVEKEREPVVHEDKGAGRRIDSDGNDNPWA